MKKFLLLLTALSMLLSFAACGNSEEPAATTEATTEATTAATTEATTTEATTAATTTEASTADTTPVEVANPALYFSMTMGDNETGTYVMLSAMELDPGVVTIEYVGDVRKVGNFDMSVMHTITAALEATELSTLNEQSEYTDGPGYASMFVQFADDSMLHADYSGTISEVFYNGYAQMEEVFLALTADLDVYVPMPMVMGDVNADALEEMNAVLSATGIQNLDSMAISDIPLDETFGYVAGLTDATGIAHGTTCAPMMLAQAYSLVIVGVESADAIDAVRADFATDIDWAKWICVSATDALIAQKGDMVIFLLAADAMYEMTAQAIAATGWENIETIHNNAW